MKERQRQSGIIAEQYADVARNEAENKSFLNRQYYQPITQRADYQNIARSLEQSLRNAQVRDDARGAVAGATGEMKLASKEANNRVFADALADMGSTTAQMRDQTARDIIGVGDNALNRRLGIGNADMQLGNPLIGINQNIAAQRSAAANNAFSNAANIFSTIIGAGSKMAASGAFG